MKHHVRTVAMRALGSGTLASLLSTAAIAALSRYETCRAVRGTNDTSHWLWGDAAFRVRRLDARHTFAGPAIQHACSVFWAIGYEVWQRRPARARTTIARAAGIAALAAAVDYTVVPKRLTPGFERHLSKPAMVGVYAAFAAGLAAAVLMRRR